MKRSVTAYLLISSKAPTGNVGTAIDADTQALREMSDPEPNEIAGLLEHDPVMSLLEKRALARLLSCAIIRRVPAGAPIFASGEPAAELMFVITGMIEIIVPNREAIALEGSRFGDGQRWPPDGTPCPPRLVQRRCWSSFRAPLSRRLWPRIRRQETPSRSRCSIAYPASLKRNLQGIGTWSAPLCQRQTRWAGYLPCWHRSRSSCLCRAPWSVTTPHHSWPF